MKLFELQVWCEDKELKSSMNLSDSDLLISSNLYFQETQVKNSFD